MNATTPKAGSGRRVASRDGRRPGRLAAAAAVTAALAGVAVASASFVEAEPASPPRTRAVPVEQVTVGCAGSPVRGRGDAATFAAPLNGAGDGGTLAVGTAAAQGSPEPSGRRGALRDLDLERGSDLVVTAEGEAARGRGTFQVDRPQGVDSLAVQQCLAPRSRWWFTGAAAGLDHASTLVLVNVDPGPAVLDVLVHGEDGPVDSVGTRGLTLQPGETTSVDLVDVAPQADELAVHVESSRGRVVAAIADSFATRPAAAAGLEWIPAHADPARVVRLAPLPARAARRTLVVANPSGREALVGLEISGESGTFAPAGLEQLRVPPGAVVTADLDEAVGTVASSVVLTSPVPVTATVRSTQGDDLSYAAPAPVLAGPSAAVVPDRTTATVQLTAGDDGGSARVVGYSAEGEPVDETDLAVDPGATATWAAGRTVAYLVVTPEEGRLSGGVSYVGGAGLAQAVLGPLPTVVRRPVVVPVVR